MEWVPWPSHGAFMPLRFSRKQFWWRLCSRVSHMLIQWIRERRLRRLKEAKTGKMVALCDEYFKHHFTTAQTPRRIQQQRTHSPNSCYSTFQKVALGGFLFNGYKDVVLCQTSQMKWLCYLKFQKERGGQWGDVLFSFLLYFRSPGVSREAERAIRLKMHDFPTSMIPLQLF